MINWKAVLTGLIITIIIALILNPFIGEFGSYTGIVIAGMIVGYRVKRNTANGIIHGALIGVTGGIAAVIILIVVGGVFIVKVEIYGLLIKTGFDIVLGAVGGAAGTIFAGKNKVKSEILNHSYFKGHIGTNPV